MFSQMLEYFCELMYESNNQLFITLSMFSQLQFNIYY